MHDNTLNLAREGAHREGPLAKHTVRIALALGCAALALAGCGGGSSSDTPTPMPLAAPTNFEVRLGNPEYLRWDATPGATRYELHADPDGPGPLPEAKLADYNPATGTGFQYVAVGAAEVQGNIYGRDVLSLTARLNASYRLRACDANGCGAFSAPRSLDIVNGLSHEFATGRVPLKSSLGADFVPRLSQDALTLAISSPSTNAADSVVYVFTRGGSGQPWQQHAVLQNGQPNFGGQIALSADGSTLAVQSNELASANANTPTQGRVYVYQRLGNTWNVQGQLEPQSGSRAPATTFASAMALSADGTVLAVSAGFMSAPQLNAIPYGAAVLFGRTAGSWTQQAVLDSGGRFTRSLALSGDGRTLAMTDIVRFALQTSDPSTTSAPAVRIFAQQSDGTWTQQARLAAGLQDTTDITGLVYSKIALSSDGSTLAVHAVNVPGHPTAELDLQPADLSCAGLASDGWYIGLYSRSGSTWQRQTAVSRGLSGTWALAQDGNALFYGNAQFTRNGTTWTCP